MRLLVLTFVFLFTAPSTYAASLVVPPVNRDLGSIFQGAWQRIVMSGEIKGSSRIPQVKDLFDVQEEANKLAYIPDQEAYQKEEYWATPRETEEKGGGDCEDFAIWKYARLRARGWKAEDLFLWSVQIKARSIFHVILVARMDGQEWLLDAPAAPEDPPVLVPKLISSEERLDALWFLAGFNEVGWMQGGS